MRRAVDLDMDPMDASDAQLKEHPLIVVGTPDEVIRKFEQLENIGMDQAICLKQAGRIPHANIVRSMELMGRHVLPHFKEKKAAATT
jgi:alkanesulfonate monooxygenase SsuD/methylene tetrahydromethanopterin reductase-like flavin-dependent oxidoreductase (luciferase family)